ncbi:MAG: hypothetical protein CMD19_07940 [Flavobacteriales bacterium]|nr:hypothetical protein [Flavobacteriales bacterium]|tara:strand:- start:60 stop:497 length:438 start_codon:yes stop_codon:yes gene_type:complete
MKKEKFDWEGFGAALLVFFLPAFAIMFGLTYALDKYLNFSIPPDFFWLFGTLGFFWLIRESNLLDKWFSLSFKKTYSIVFVCWSFCVWYGGILDYLMLEAQKPLLVYIGVILGVIFSLILIPLLATYPIKLLIPFFKKIHNKVNK